MTLTRRQLWLGTWMAILHTVIVLEQHKHNFRLGSSSSLIHYPVSTIWILSQKLQKLAMTLINIKLIKIEQKCMLHKPYYNQSFHRDVLPLNSYSRMCAPSLTTTKMGLAMKIGIAVIRFAYDSDTVWWSVPAYYPHKSYAAQQLCENLFAAAQRAPPSSPCPSLAPRRKQLVCERV